MYKRKWTPGLSTNPKSKIGRYRSAVAKARTRRSKSVAALNARTGGVLGLELKYSDVIWTGAAITAPADCSGAELVTAAGPTGFGTNIAQGDTEILRDGRQAVVKSIHVKGVISWTASADDADPLVGPTIFMAMVQDTQANGTICQSEDVFEDNGSAVTNVQPFRVMGNMKRFRILASKLFVCPTLVAFTDGASTGSVIPCRQIPVNLYWKGTMKVNYVGTSAADASIADNSVTLIAFASNTNYTPAFTGCSRTRFLG